ncbi:Cell death abnormality protein 1 [Diplonema papillatum]|nr:Cell death abnormality protein 1 [Diplonema papillatum]
MICDLVYPVRWDGEASLVIEMCLTDGGPYAVAAAPTAFDAVFYNRHDTLCTPDCRIWCTASGVISGIDTMRPVLRAFVERNAFETCALGDVRAVTCGAFVAEDASKCCSRLVTTTLHACEGGVPEQFTATSPAFVLCPNECTAAGESCAATCKPEHGRADPTGLFCYSWYDENRFVPCSEPPCRSYACEDDVRCSLDFDFMCGVEAGLEDFPVEDGRLPFEAGTPARLMCPVMCGVCVDDCSLQSDVCGGPSMCADIDGRLNGIFECGCHCESELRAESTHDIQLCPSDNPRCLGLARRGWCGYAPSSEGLCLSELPANTESETFAEPFVLDDLCVCSAGGFSEGACSEENGACVKVKETPEPIRDVPSLFDNALQVVVGHFLGFGNCVDAEGRQYAAFEKEVDGEVECRAWAVEFMKGRCGMVGAEYDEPTCRVLTTLPSAGEQDEAPGTSFVTREGGEGNPVDVRPLDSALCFNYFAPSCSYSDDCTRCHEQACVSTVAAPGLCTSPDTGFECTPKCAGISFLRSCSDTAREELSFVVVDDASEEEGVVEDARVHDFVVLGAEFATCEEAGHERITVEVDCKRALCQSADVVWILDKIPSNDSALVPSGCTAECSSLEGGVCQLRTATFNTNGLLACNEARRLGKQCLCKRYRGPVVSADTAGTCGDYDALPLFFVQTFGSCGSSSNKASYAVGPTPFEGVVPAYAITDVTTESNCRAAACFLLGFRSDEDSPLATFGGYSMPAGATAQVPYTGAGGWTGGCSFGESRAVFMPPSPCGDQQTRAACAATRGCRWSDGAGCAESTAGNTACSEERPCLCRRRDATLVEVVTGVELAVSEGQYKSMFRVPSEDGKDQAAAVLKTVEALVFNAASSPGTPARTALVCLRSRDSEPLQWCLNAAEINALLAGRRGDLPADPAAAAGGGRLFVQVRQQVFDTAADALRRRISAALAGGGPAAPAALLYSEVTAVGAAVADPVCARPSGAPRECPVTVDYFDSGAVRECNPCAALTCTADYSSSDEDCDAFDVAVAAGGATTLEFSALATSSTDGGDRALAGVPTTVVVEKTQVSGAVAFAVAFGRLAGAAAHYAAPAPREDERVVLNACGAFAVRLAAEGGEGGAVTLRVCYPNKACADACAGASADGRPHGACRLAVHGGGAAAAACVCEENFGRASAAGTDCRLCAWGRFPAPGPGVAAPCAMRCEVGAAGEVQGVYDAAADACACAGGWEGATCGSCPADNHRFGPYCNESNPAAAHAFAASAAGGAPYTPPPWRVVGGTTARFEVREATEPSRVSKFTVTSHRRLDAEVDPPSLAAAAPPSANTVDAAFYAPPPATVPAACLPGLAGGGIYLHVLKGAAVHVFTVNGTREATLHCSPSLAEYYAAWSISRCLSAFGEPSVERVDAAFYRKNAGRGGDEFTLVKDNKLCTARGSPFKFGGGVVAVSGLFGLPSLWDDAVNVLHPGFAACNESLMATSDCASGDVFWSDLMIVGTGPAADFVAVQGKEAVVVQTIGFYCCGGDGGGGAGGPCQCGAEFVQAFDAQFPGVFEYPVGVVRPVEWKALYINDIAVRMPLSDYFAQLPKEHRPIIAAASGDQFPSASPLNHPAVFFSDYTVYINGEEILQAEVFPLPLLPRSLSLVSSSVDGLENPSISTTDTEILAFTLQLVDAFGSPCPIDNDVFLTLEEECVSVETVALVNVLSSAVPNSSLEAAAEACETADRALYGHDHVKRVSSEPTYSVSISSIGFATEGRRRLKFVHLKSGLSLVSQKFLVETAPCNAAGPTVQTCVSTCVVSNCAIKLRPSTRWIRLKVETEGKAAFDLRASIAQPCCNGHGLCCAGGDSCTRSVVAAFRSEEHRCDCHADPVTGYWDRRLDSNCSACLPGFSGPLCTRATAASSDFREAFSIEEGEGATYAFTVGPQTIYDVALRGAPGSDLDLYVAWLSCPGQTAPSQLQPGKVSIPCSGRGRCVLLESFEAQCVCLEGFTGDDCGLVDEGRGQGLRRFDTMSVSEGAVLQYADLAKSINLTIEGTTKVMLRAECASITDGADEICRMLVPENVAFAVVRATGFKSGSGEVGVSFVGTGKFSPEGRYGSCVADAENGYWAGTFCDKCAFGLKGSSCTEFALETCNATTCAGECATRDFNGTSRECVFCDANATCHARGRCRSAIEDPGLPCECAAPDVAAGFWDAATNCSTCLLGYWGAGCDRECRCNLRGRCDSTGACICYDDERGHYGGPACADCAAGYAADGGGDCVMATRQAELKRHFATAPPVIHNNTRSGRGAFSVIGRAAADNPGPGRRSMAALSTQTELALAAAGLRTEGVLLVDAWVKPADSSVNFMKTHVRSFSAHAQTEAGDATGDDLRFIFVRGGYVYFLVDAGRPYIGRWPASDDMHAAPERTGFAGSGFDEQLACDAQPRGSCPAGTEVVHPRFGTGVIFESNGTTSACVVAVDKASTCIATSLCNEDLCGNNAFTHYVDVADIMPQNNVVWLGTDASNTSFSLVGFSYLHSSDEFVVVLNVNTPSASSALVQKAATSIFKVSGDAFSLFPFAGGGVDQFHTVDAASRPWLLAFGRSGAGTRIVVKVFIAVGQKGYALPFLSEIPVCFVYQCIAVDSVAQVTLQGGGDHNLLVAFYVQEASGFRSLLWKLDLNDPRRDLGQYVPRPECSAAVWNVPIDEAALRCEQAQCYWTGRDCVWRQYALLSNTGSVGVTAMAADAESHSVFVCLGLHSLSTSSEIAKIRLSTLQPMVRVPLGPDETVVSLFVEAARRALFALSSTRSSGLSFAVINMFDVLSVTPSVVDASGGSEVVVSGSGMQNLGGAVRMRIGNSPGNCTRLDEIDGVTRHTCTTGSSEVSSDCTLLSLEITPVDEVRWSVKEFAVKYIETPTVYELGTAQLAGNWRDIAYLGALRVLPLPDPAAYHDLADDGSVATRLRADGPGTFGPSTEDVGIIVSGSGFTPADTARCRINGTVVPATVLSAMRAVCVLKATNLPFSAAVEVSMDGQVYSSQGPKYTSVGSPAAIVAFLSCSSDVCENAQHITVQSSEVIRLNFTVLVKDANGVFLGDAWTGEKGATPTATAAFSSSKIEINGDIVVRQNRGMFVFDNVRLDRPTAGDFALEFTYRPLFLRSSVVITVESGQPVQLRCVTEPAPFSNNRNPLTTQPVFAIEDASGNTVTDSIRDLYVRASLVNIDAHLFLANGQAAIEISEFTSSIAVASGFHIFQRLTVLAVGGLSGKSLQYKEGAAPNEYEEVYFGVRFDVFSRSKGVEVIEDDKALMFQMRMVDCSVREVGHTLLAYVEPEELPTTSGTPVSIVGWEFFNTTVNGEEVSQYYCDLRHAGNSSFAGQVAAKFRDSCTLVCDPFPDAIRATPAMYSITPSMCCAKFGDSLPCVTARTGADCRSEHDTAVEAPSFNGTLLRADQYVRYIGKGAKVRLFNLNIPLPQFAVGQGHAAFESLNIWAADAAAQYNITFEFYGAHETYGIALQPLSHVLDASLCASECDSAVCSFEPSEFNTSRADGSHGDELVLFGDYYDLAKAGGNRNRMKLRFVVSTNQTELTCDVTTRLRDACSVVATFPTCPYLCENVYPLIARTEDRISCCSTGTTTDGRACQTTSSFTTRSVVLLQVRECVTNWSFLCGSRHCRPQASYCSGQ